MGRECVVRDASEAAVLVPADFVLTVGLDNAALRKGKPEPVNSSNWEGRSVRFRIVFVCAVCLFLVVASGGAIASTLEDIKNRGEVICGVNALLLGFAAPNEKAEWRGFNIDWCNAIAAAVDVKPNYRPVSPTERFVALATGEIDVLTRSDTWTLSRDAGLGIMFIARFYYEQQTFLVRKEVGATKLADLKGAAACVIAGTSGAANIADLFGRHNIPYEPVTFKSGVEQRLAYGTGRCDFLFGDAGPMAANRLLQKNPDDHVLFKERWGREPYGMSVRNGDDQWAKIVRAVFNAIVLAELHGITKENVDEVAATSKDTEVKNLLGKSRSLGEKLGLDNQWAYRAIKAVGNYGQIWERNLTPIGLERNLNKLFSEGGVLYPVPFK